MASPKTSAIVSRFLVGGLVVGILAGVTVGAISLFSVSVLEQITSGGGEVRTFEIALVALQYIAAFAVMDALTLVWITQPIIGYVVQSLSVLNAAALGGIHQRASDSGSGAEGFADALDVGAAF